ncbi:uncharacterized protein LOC126904971 [Daktulosphaira vitifoliae]|uniref:uncharacterized protein LOC126904971 n=1 Tax=Daktulosphaira vitifoliae TaxID=58002 RepID=UPI0021AA5B9E|nr:uncharacterized protein LOC126904971 [Daktulosphaira vitifoliae]
MLQLADPYFDIPSPIDMLLRADIFSKIMTGDRRDLGADLPTAFGSIFGWLLIDSAGQRQTYSNVTSLTVTIPSLEQLVEKFWEIENVKSAQLEFTDNEACEVLFQNEYQGDSDGRVSVPLPFHVQVKSHSFIGSKQVTLKRFEHLERKFKTNDKLYESYKTFMSDYETLGHMKRATEPGIYFIPHHAVRMDDTPDGKFRVVYDTSAKDITGRSLNDCLYNGPKLQQDIVDVLIRFCVYQIAFTSDISKMYRQILVNESYRKYQHILRRSSPLHELSEYELCTVTYGMASAPYIALRLIKQIAEYDYTAFPDV